VGLGITVKYGLVQNQWKISPVDHETRYILRECLNYCNACSLSPMECNRQLMLQKDEFKCYVGVAKPTIYIYISF
jgi:hypothetical protein